MAIDDVYTKVLLHFDGADGSIVFYDESKKSWTPTGLAQIDTGQYRIGTGSAYFNPSDNISTPNVADIILGTSDITIDFWVRFATLTNGTYPIFLMQYTNSGNYWDAYYGVSEKVLAIEASSGGSVLFNLQWDWTPSLNTWYHVAIVKNSNVYNAYINGNVIGTSKTNAAVFPTLSSSLIIGNNFNGWLDEFRLSVGIARWSSNFTPSSIVYGTPENLQIIIDETGKTWDNAGINLAILDEGSRIFGASSGKFVSSEKNYLHTATSNDFNFGTGDFTIDCWIKRDGTHSLASICGTNVANIGAHSNAGWSFGFFTTGNTLCFDYGVSSQLLGATVIPDLTWTHVAVVYSSPTMKFYINGIADTNTWTNTTGLPFTEDGDGCVIGRMRTQIDEYYWNGWIDELRISKGIARWTSDFTPPDNPYVLDSYTKSLLHFDTTPYQYASGNPFTDECLPINFNFDFNSFHQIEVPELNLCNPDKTQLTSLRGAHGVKNTVRYNALSELYFDYPKSADGGITIDPAYALLIGKKLILVENVGYYIINSCPEDDSGSIPVKHINALSLEAELIAPRLTGFTGTYSFADLLQKVLDLKPSWTIGTIDSSLLSLYRTFNSNNTTAYNFMMNEMEKAYGCVFVFDTFNKRVCALSNALPVVIQSNIFLSFDNILKSIEFKEITEEICTAMYCYGGGNLDIRNVNPLGGAAIYNFSYFKTAAWMSQGLIDALDYWENSVAGQQSSYANSLTELENYNSAIVVLEGDLVNLNSQLATLISDSTLPSPPVDIDAQISAKRTEIASKQVDIQNIQDKINYIQILLRKIVHTLFFTSRISFDNMEDDSASIIDSLTNISKTWKTNYNETSVLIYPDFNVAELTRLTPDIELDISDAIEQMKTIKDTINPAWYISYPPLVSEIDILQNDVSSAIDMINELRGDFQYLIPATTEVSTLSEIISTLTAYLDIIYFPENMTYSQYLELTSYIYENTYTNSNIIITDIMSPVDVQAQSQTLYNQSLGVLEKSAYPRYEFSGQYSNFLAIENFISFIKELKLGNQIYIQKSDETIIEATLLEVILHYDSPTDFEMTFGNRFRLDDSSFIYGDLMGEAAQLSSNLPTTTAVGNSVSGTTQNITIVSSGGGSQGVTGIQGITGLRGVTGLQGITGLRGVTGLQGITGLRGVTGLQGITGLRGVTGIGITGSQGITGIQGVTGMGGGAGSILENQVFG